MVLKVEHHIFAALSSAAQFGGRLLAGGGGTDNSFDHKEGYVTDEYGEGGNMGHGVNPSKSLEEYAEEHGGGGHGDDHHGFGIHITYDDLYASIIFFTIIYVMGAISQRYLKMPSLVGEIFAGILLGPNLADFVPNPEAFVMLGEIGLILLVLEAGIDIDLTTLKLIGARGIVIAIIGSVLPIAIGLAIAFGLGIDTKGSIAAGAAFGPTSLGIAMNILRQGKIVNTPVGQLVVSAAVIDDMIALVILSQLSALTGEVQIVNIIVPIASALLFLVLGGYIAVYILPPLLDRFILSKVKEENMGYVSMMIMLGLMLGLMPATYYAKASFLMGVFVSGLTFCRSHEVHHAFVRQFKRLLQWLMRVFFAASIGFQVPITHFGKGQVIWKGLVFTLALSGKIAVGFLVPNFNQAQRFSGLHLRDCLITGFSMAAEGEFAFVIAVFAVDNGLISQDVYASVVLAVLISTIIPPFLLRFTIAHYNKKSEQMVEEAANLEYTRRMDLENGNLTEEEKNKVLAQGILDQTTVFLCIQTQSESSWGLLPRIMATLGKLKLEVIDHRSWHPRGVDTTMVNEIFVKDHIESVEDGASQVDVLENRMEEVREKLAETIDQPDSRVRVNRWLPGVLQEIIEEETENITTKKKGERLALSNKALSKRIMSEASMKLERDRDLQMKFTQERSVQQLLGIDESKIKGVGGPPPPEDAAADGEKKKKPRRVRQKMRSTPVIGGDLFGESRAGDFGDMEKPAPAPQMAVPTSPGGVPGPSPATRARKLFGYGPADGERLHAFDAPAAGVSADLRVDGETFKIRISSATLNRIRSGFSGAAVDDGAIQITAAEVPIMNRLQGFVRNQDALSRIEETEMSEVSESVAGSDFGDVEHVFTDDTSQGGVTSPVARPRRYRNGRAHELP